MSGQYPGVPQHQTPEQASAIHQQHLAQRAGTQQASQQWLTQVPGAYAATKAQPDGKLSDLLNSTQTGRAVHQAISQVLSGQQPSQSAPTNLQHHPQVLPAQGASQPIYSQPQQSYGPAHALQAAGLPGQAYRPQYSTAQQLPPGAQAVQGQAMPWMAQQSQLRPQAGQNVAAMYQGGRPAVSYMQPTPAAVAQQYNTLLSSMRPGFIPQPLGHPPIPQLSEEDRKVLPRKSLKRKAVSAAKDENAEMDSDLESALVQVADDFITTSVAFACGIARRRKSKKLEASDVAVYLDRIWQLRVPGFSGSQIKPYRRPAAKILHTARTACIRKELATASETAATPKE